MVQEYFVIFFVIGDWVELVGQVLFGDYVVGYFGGVFDVVGSVCGDFVGIEDQFFGYMVIVQ